MNNTHHEFSPSRLQRLHACPGSYRMEQGLPDVSGADAERGTRLHEACATLHMAGLSPEELNLAAKALKARESVMIEGAELHTEEHLTIRDPETDAVLTEGTADVVIVHEGEALVADYKFGASPVPPASKNLQLAAYALGVMQRYQVRQVTARIIQPLASDGGGEAYTFTRPDAILRNIRSIIARCKADSVTLCPGDHCTYCRAFRMCPAARARMGAVVPAGDTLPGIPTDADALSDLWARCKLAERYISAVKAKLTETMDANGGRCGRWAWKEVPGRREITDLPAAFAAVSVYLSQADFLSLCKISVTGLIDAVARRDQNLAAQSGEKLTLTEAKERWENRLKDCITRGEATRSIVEVMEVEK